MHRTPRVVLAASVLVACYASPNGALPSSEISPASVDWNPQKLDVGVAAQLVDELTDVTIFSDHGAVAFSGGSIAAVDATATEWIASSVIPAADARGSWVVGVAASGHLYRFHSLSTLEDVGERYGLIDYTGVAALGGTLVGFGLKTQIAIADGTKIVQYDAPAGKFFGASGRLGTLAADQVYVMSAATKSAERYFISGGHDAAIDNAGRLVVTRDDSVLVEKGGKLVTAFVTDGEQTGSLAVSGARTWFAYGSHVGYLDGDQVGLDHSHAYDGEVRLFGSPSGDVWIRHGGVLERLSTSTTPEDRWRGTVLPVFSRTCSQCHLPGGAGDLDLSNYNAWVTNKDRINAQVVVKRSMPPSGIAFTDADRAIIAAWESE